jgi:uncharacterized Tic20 family protein
MLQTVFNGRIQPVNERRPMPETETQAPPPIEPPPPAPPAASSPPPPNPEAQARTWNMLCHLSALAGFIGVPLGNILGPLLVWQIKKNEFPSVDIHGKAALNFQITVLIGILASFVVGLILSFICIGVVFFFVAMAIGLAGLIFAIIAGIKANNGEDYKYPWSLTFVK